MPEAHCEVLVQASGVPGTTVWQTPPEQSWPIGQSSALVQAPGETGEQVPLEPELLQIPLWHCAALVQAEGEGRPHWPPVPQTPDAQALLAPTGAQPPPGGSVGAHWPVPALRSQYAPEAHWLGETLAEVQLLAHLPATQTPLRQSSPVVQSPPFGSPQTPSAPQ